MRVASPFVLMLAVLFPVLLFLGSCGDGAKPGTTGTPGDAGGGVPAGAPTTRVDPSPPGPGTWKDRAKVAIDGGIRFLNTRRTPDGKWKFSNAADAKPELGITAMVLLGMMESPRKYRESDGPMIRLGLEWLVASQKDDGSIHTGGLMVYNTSLAVLALVASENPKYKPTINKAVEYLRVAQSDEGEGYNGGDRYYGGIGYGSTQRPDLSNTQWALEAVRKAGLKPDDPMFKKATAYLQRSQNRSESNDLKDTAAGVVPGNDGGGYYSPGITDGEAKAGFVVLTDGTKVRRSYGSMSYALLKSYLFCDLDRRDARVRAVFDWANKNYRLDINPGMEAVGKPGSEKTGLFYYWLTMARTLPMAADGLVDAAGKPRDWKKDLAEAILAKQSATDGAWANEKVDFWENSPVLATAMAVVALDACVR